jgi:hypothetical protein
MKGTLFIQRRKGKLLKNVYSYFVDINGGENNRDRKLYAFDHSMLISELHITDIVIGADGIMFRGWEPVGDKYFYQEWFFTANK